MLTSVNDRLAIVVPAGDNLKLTQRRASLEPACGRPAICFVIEAALRAGADEIVVAGTRDEELSSILAAIFGERVRCFAEGRPPRVYRQDAHDGYDPICLIVPGNRLLVEGQELRRLAEAVDSTTQLALLTVPPGFSNVVSHMYYGASEKAVEMLDGEAGAAACRMSFLQLILSEIEPKPDRTELDLSQLAAVAAHVGTVVRVIVNSAQNMRKVDDLVELAAAEHRLYARIADELRRAGAVVRGHPRIDAGVVVEADAIIEDRVSLRGATRIGSGARIDVGSVLTDVVVAARAVVKPYSVCTQAVIGEAAEVGPFSHIRPDSEIQANARIGNFVETKKVTVRRGAMANHLAYLGDGDVGEGANIGAGTIFCNSDGINKHRTEVGDGAFVGSACQLVAPVRVGAGAFVATGTTVTRDVPDDAFAIARVPQENKERYAARLRERLAALAAKLMPPKQ